MVLAQAAYNTSAIHGIPDTTPSPAIVIATLFNTFFTVPDNITDIRNTVIFPATTFKRGTTTTTHATGITSVIITGRITNAGTMIEDILIIPASIVGNENATGSGDKAPRPAIACKNESFQFLWENSSEQG